MVVLALLGVPYFVGTGEFPRGITFSLFKKKAISRAWEALLLATSQALQFACGGFIGSVD